MASIVERGRKVSLECKVALHTRNRVAESTDDIKVARSVFGLSQCAIARFAHSLLVTDRYWSDDLTKRVVIPANQGHELIAVRLDEHEEACISLTNLVGFSENITFRTVFDFAITSWSINRAFQYLAMGPGLLLFDCFGEPAILNSHAELKGQRIQVGRLVMWPKDLEFHADEVHSGVDLYIGDARFFITYTSSTIPVILDVNDQHVGSPAIWGLISKLYKPW